MLKREVITSLLCYPRRILSVRCQSSAIDIKKLEEESVQYVGVEDDNAAAKEEELQRKRNKSGLTKQHYNVLHNTRPFDEPQHWTHLTLQYHRKQFGRYGKNSQVDPALCWMSKEELANKIEYESVAHPYTIQEMQKAANERRQDREKRTAQRQQELVKKMEKLEGWKRELLNKIAKKEAEAYAAKQRKEKLIEEVRRHFGYTVDPKDEKFKEMLEKKEKEQRKQIKEAKKKAKEDKLVAKLITKKEDTNSEKTTD